MVRRFQRGATLRGLSALAIAVVIGASFTAAVVACGSGEASEPDTKPAGRDSGGDETGNSEDPNFGDGGSDDPTGDGSPGSPGTLVAFVRDFKAYNPNDTTTNPDFENPSFAANQANLCSGGTTGLCDPGFVLPDLGADGKPQYNTAVTYNGAAGRSLTTNGKTFFDQWYNDVSGVNTRLAKSFTLTKDASGTYVYDSATVGTLLDPSKAENAPVSFTTGWSTPNRKNFFPIDNEGFGNQDQPTDLSAKHNYHFTVEMRTKFTYRGNETFTFTGDDDVFVFINKKRVIDLGGIHSVQTATVKLSDRAAELGLVVGNEYPLDFFQAERHVIESNVRIETTLELVAGPVR